MKLSPFAKGLILVLVLLLLAGGLIFLNRIRAGDAFTREEALHGLYGVWIWRGIKAADWGAFWYDTGRQMVWPFLHSWLLAIMFVDFGVSYVSARLLSLLLFLGSIVVLYGIANQLSERSGWKIGLGACLLMLTSPLAVNFSSASQIEMLGVFIFLLAAYVYSICRMKKLVVHYILLALIIGMSIYTNYIYAYFMIPAFIVVSLSKLGPLFMEALSLRRRGEEAAVPFIWWAYKKMLVLSILLVIAGIWFSFNFTRRIMFFLDAILRANPESSMSFWQGLIYYPGVIIRQLSFSPWLGLFLLAGLLTFFISLRYRGLSKYFGFVWTVLILATLTVSAKTPQMIFIIVPFIFLIFSVGFFSLYEDLKARSPKLALGLVLALLLPAMVSLPRAYALYFPARTAENMIDVLDYFKAAVPFKAESGTTINLQRFNSEVVQFHFWDRPGHVLTDEYVKVGQGPADQVYYLTLFLDNDSPYQREVRDDSVHRWNTWLKDEAMNGRIRLYSSKRFESIGLTARIYQQVPRRH